MLDPEPWQVLDSQGVLQDQCRFIEIVDMKGGKGRAAWMVVSRGSLTYRDVVMRREGEEKEREGRGEREGERNK